MPELTLAPDGEAAAWLRPRLLDWGAAIGVRTGSVVPTGYEAYARVFHPAEIDGDVVRWADVAARRGRTAHRNMQWEGITGDPPSDMHGIEIGSLPQREAEALVNLLAEHTTTPDRCWFAVWDGFGDMPRGHPPRVHHLHRTYVLLSGDIAAAARHLWRGDERWAMPYQSPNLWWPDDRAWVVGTEIDYAWTYVAGTARCIADVVAAPALEVFEVQVDDRGDIRGDDVNPLPHR